MWHAWEISEIHTQLPSEDLTEHTIRKLYKYIVFKNQTEVKVLD